MQERYHVLHIDDDVFIKRIILNTLSADFELTFCDNGIEAMSWLEKGNYPDIILTDLRMPLLDGQDFISLVRSSSIYRNLPIIVLSGSEDSELIIDCINQGADDFIIKPFNPFEIKAKIKALLRQANEQRNLQSNVESTPLNPAQE